MCSRAGSRRRRFARGSQRGPKPEAFEGLGGGAAWLQGARTWCRNATPLALARDLRAVSWVALGLLAANRQFGAIVLARVGMPPAPCACSGIVGSLGRYERPRSAGLAPLVPSSWALFVRGLCQMAAALLSKGGFAWACAGAATAHRRRRRARAGLPLAANRNPAHWAHSFSVPIARLSFCTALRTSSAQSASPRTSGSHSLMVGCRRRKALLVRGREDKLAASQTAAVDAGQRLCAVLLYWR